MVYFVYALDTVEKRITVALSFQDKKTAILAYGAARQMMKKKRGADRFHFGYTDDVSRAINGDSDDSRIRIDYELPPRSGYQRGWQTYAIIGIDDFVAAELLTRKFLADTIPPRRQLDIQFMYEVQSIMANCTADGVSVSGCEKHESTITPLKRAQAQVVSPVEPNIVDYPFMMQAASSRGNPKSAVEACQESIEWAKEPARVIVKNKKPIITSESPDSPLVEVINKLNERLDKTFIIEFAPDEIKSLLPEDCPIEGKEGFWESQKEYAFRIDKEESTLKQYRQTKNGVKLSKDDTWGMDKAGNIFKKTGDKTNSPFLYFVRHDS